METAKNNLSILPKHIGIIIDGNGRWAEKRGQKRSYGHQVGTKKLYNIITSCVKLNIQYLTVYVFSKENWKRPQEEVESLMNLFEKGLDIENLLNRNNIRLQVSGDLIGLPKHVTTFLNKCIKETQTNNGLTLCLALNYSSRMEIVNAVKILTEKANRQSIRSIDVTEQLFSEHLYIPSMPDIDFIIRTGGEYRLSNFMLWQSSYAELYFTQTLWPDFEKKDLLNALLEYQKRERRFGNIR